MAKFNLDAYNANQGFGLPLNIRRGNPNPLDNSSVWKTLEAAQKYATSDPVAYVGQIITVANNENVSAYVISNEAGTLVKLAQTTASGDLAADVAELQGKVDTLEKKYLEKNPNIAGATHTKITYDAKGLVTGGEDLSVDDIPAGLPSSKITGLDDKLGTLATTEALEQVAGDLSSYQTSNDAALADANQAIAAEKARIDTLTTGSGEGSIDKKISTAIDEFATKMSDDGTINTFKEIVDYVAADKTGTAKIISDIAALQEADKTITINVTANKEAAEANAQDITALTGRVKANEAITATVGAVSDLATDKKDTLVNAINELETNSNKIASDLTSKEAALTEKITAVETTANGAVQKAEGSRLMTNAEGTKLAGIATGAQVNKIEAVKQNGVALSVGEDKSVDVDAYTKGAIDKKVTALEGKITTAQEKADQGVTNAATAQSKANANAKLIEALQGVDTEQGEKIAALETAINGGVGDSSNGLTKKLEALTSTVSGQGQSIADLQSKDTQIEASVSAVNEKADANTGKITALETKLSAEGTTGKAIAALQARDNELQSSIDANETAINTKANSKDVYTKTQIGTFTESSLIEHIVAEDTKLQKNIDGKAAKATTLAGYGITDAYTQEEANTAIATAVANAPHLKREIVENLENVEKPDVNTIYMVKDTSVSGDAKDNDTYKEYMYIGGKFELVGNSKVDLTGYVQTQGESYQAVLTKLATIEEHAQVNKIESITINGTAAVISEKAATVTLPAATVSNFGLVKSSNAENQVAVNSQGVMTVNSLNVNKLAQTSGDTLILNGGNAASSI